MLSTLPLKELLLRLGSLREEAWQELTMRVQQRIYKPYKSIILPPTGVIYVQEGLLKQYQRSEREAAAITRFITTNQHIFIPTQPDNLYIKTILESTLWYWEGEAVHSLLLCYPELYALYQQLRDRYDALLDIRMRILESKHIQKLQLFQEHFHKIRPYLRAKDIANYIGVHPNYISKLYKT
ncbi:hypothetical protein GCM10023231_00540 [Olivibacter ginsenosidimutans]|uniref:Crp/Fnr family transcriptional regulator n=1 Tax=Olivibacter ginsenosidimutans TaxID=1176537 RepID=A0ABP9AAZ7_9SPHI